MYITTKETRDTLTIKISTASIRHDAANRAEFDAISVRIAELVARAAVLDLDIQNQIFPWRP